MTPVRPIIRRKRGFVNSGFVKVRSPGGGLLCGFLPKPPIRAAAGRFQKRRPSRRLSWGPDRGGGTRNPSARLSGYLDSSIEYTLRVWALTADFWDLYFDLLEQIGAAFDREGIDITYNHLNVHLMDRK